MTQAARVRSPSAALRGLCLAGIAFSSAPASADPLDLLRRVTEPPYPRCTPVPPRSVITVGAPVLAPLPGPVNDLAVDPYGQEWVFGDDGGAWYRAARSPWVPQVIGATDDLNAAVQGQVLWVVGDGGGVWSRDHTGTWGQHDLSDTADFTHVSAEGAAAAVASSDGVLYATRDGGAAWQRLAAPSDGAITALDLGYGMVVAARSDGTLFIAQDEADGAGGWRWRSSTRDLPTAAPIRAVMAYGPTAFFVVDEAGTLWSSYGSVWSEAAGRPAPIRALTKTALGITAVHADGSSSIIELRQGERAVLKPTASFATGTVAALPSSPGLSVRAAVGSEQRGLLALTTDGQIFHQQIAHHIEGGHPCGRPFEVDRSAVCAPAAAGAGWAGAVLPPAALPEASRAALAAAWLRDAQAEHASVASFARFALRLLALGAPSALVADAQAAMGDEIRHAERCFALASRYAGAPLRPGPLPVGGALDGGTDLAAVSVEVLREGAIGESIGALLADAMRQKATDPHVQDALAGIADDEARHAQAAWRFLGWAVREGGAPVRDALSAALEDAIEAHLPSPAGPAAEEVPLGWAAHGRLTAAEQRRLIRRAIRQVVRPCMASIRAPGAPAGPRSR